MSLEEGRHQVDAADTKIISLVAAFTQADQTAFNQDFDKFVDSKPDLQASITKRFNGVADVVLAKLKDMPIEEQKTATSYREERHLAVIANRVDRSVKAGGDSEISKDFFEKLLAVSVAEQDNYIQERQGVLCHYIDNNAPDNS